MNRRGFFWAIVAAGLAAIMAPRALFAEPIGTNEVSALRNKIQAGLTTLPTTSMEKLVGRHPMTVWMDDIYAPPPISNEEYRLMLNEFKRIMPTPDIMGNPQ